MGLMALAVFSYWLQRRSPTILRWMPLGEARLALRERVNRPLITSAAGSSDARARSLTAGTGDDDSLLAWQIKDQLRKQREPATTFQIFCDPADQGIADEVESGLRSFGFAPTAGQAPQVALFVLTNLTHLDDLKRAGGDTS